MKIISLIGTRPQYIKIKPLADKFIDAKVNHIIVDTNQHFSYNVSGSIIKDLDIKIDYNLAVDNKCEVDFIKDCIQKINDLLTQEQPDLVILYGDTNSTFVGSLVSHKLGIKVAHVESGLRCHNFNVPEEINRRYCDMISFLKFCSSNNSLENVQKGILSGDLEYELLEKRSNEISYSGKVVLTLHRQENLFEKKLRDIFSFCSIVKEPIIFPIHHRTKSYLQKYGIEVSDNIELVDPCNYSEMISLLCNSKFNITDSGGIQKTSPFFGKKTLIFRNETEWGETISADYCRIASYNKEDLDWLSDFKRPIDRRFYMAETNPSEIIIRTIKENFNLK